MTAEQWHDKQPLAVALSNDYEVVVRGLEQMLAPFADRVTVAELDAGVPLRSPVDLTLYDTFSQGQVDGPQVDRILSDPRSGKVVIFTWNLQPNLISLALDKGARGYLSKALSAEHLVDALVQIAAGEVLVCDSPDTAPRPATDADRNVPPSELAEDDAAEQDDAVSEGSGEWPGSEFGLTARESEVVALITQGLSNAEIATRSYLSINSVKSYIRAAYRKMGVESRSQAVLWGVQHGMLPTPRRIIREP